MTSNGGGGGGIMCGGRVRGDDDASVPLLFGIIVVLRGGCYSIFHPNIYNF